MQLYEMCQQSVVVGVGGVGGVGVRNTMVSSCAGTVILWPMLGTTHRCWNIREAITTAQSRSPEEDDDDDAPAIFATKGARNMGN